MVIEDDSAMRALLRDVLERAGYRVIALPDGRTLEAMIDCEFEAVILDRELPGPGGEELLSLLRRRRPDAPVIFITAFGGSDVAHDAIRRGAALYIEKPFRVSAIVNAVIAVLARDHEDVRFRSPAMDTERAPDAS
jgi:two-component system response regulator FlrC